MDDNFAAVANLRKQLSVVDLLAYGLVFMMPIAPMVIFGTVFVASRGMVLLAHVVGATAMGFTAVSHPQTATLGAGFLVLAGLWVAGMRPRSPGMPIADHTMGAHHA